MASSELPLKTRRVHLWLLALACFLAVLGSRTAYVHHFGSDMPTWDQWDAESARLLAPYEQGRLAISDLFEPHNEHRIVVTKLFALGLYLANGQWDARLECTANAAMVAIIAVILLFFGRRLIDVRWRLAWLAAVLGAFAAPLSWQNVNTGFHTPQTFLVGFSFAAIALLTTARPTSVRWWLGCLCAALTLITLASGLLAAAAVIGILVLTLPLGSVLRRHGLTIAVCAIIFVVGLSVHHPVPHHDPLKARSLAEFALSFWRNLQWPLVNLPLYGLISWLPWAGLLWRVRRQGEEATPGERVVAGAGLWVLFQCIASAYARGVDGSWPADRYLDTIGFGIAVNVLALLILLSHAPLSSWPGRVRTTLAVVGAVLLTHGWWAHVSETIYGTGPRLRAEHIDREFHTRAFVHTGDVSFLREGHIPHPSAEVLRRELTQEEIRRVLPASIRVPVEVPGMTDPAGSGFTSPGLPPEATPPPGWPMLGSFGAERAAGTGSWASGPLPSPKFGYWVIPTAVGSTISAGLKLELSDASGRHPIELAHGHDPRLPDARWNHAVVRAPRGESRLHVEDSTSVGWLAVGAPVEMATGSYWAWRLGGIGLILFGCGAAWCALAELNLLGRANWRHVLPGWVRRSYAEMPRPVAITTAALSGVVVGLATYALTDPREPAFFVATLRGKLNEKSIELFYDRGRGIRGADSAQSWFHEDIEALEIRLPMPAGTYKALRFDPMDFGSTTIIENPRIETEQGEVLRYLDPALFVPMNDLASVNVKGNQVIATATPAGGDPQLRAELNPPLSTLPGDRGRLGRWLSTLVASSLSILLLPPSVIMMRKGARWVHAHRAAILGFDWRSWSRQALRSVNQSEHRTTIVLALVLAVVLGTLAIRKTDTFLNPQLWAEDASLFYIQAEAEGIATLLLPYNGYLLLVQRLLAYPGPFVNAALLPATYVWLSAVVLLLVAAHTLSPRLALPLKPLLAIAIVAVPHTGEVFLNVTNTQWLTAIVLLQMAIKDDWVTSRQRVVDLSIVTITGLTGPFSILFLPLFAWRAWRRRTVASAIILATVAVCAAIQVTCMVQVPASTMPGTTSEIDIATLLGVVGQRLVYAVLTGPYVPEGDSRWFVAITAGAFLAALFARSLRRHPLRSAKLTLWFACAVIVIASLYRFQFRIWDFHDTQNCDRYFLLPKIFICWLLLLEAYAATWTGWLARSLLIVGFCANLATFRMPPLHDHHWAEHCDALQRGERADIPITPSGWIFQYPGRPK